jgi:tetratricopeptide (TPR) repeat protein
LGELLPSELATDPAYEQAKADLSLGEYRGAFNTLRQVARRHPSEADVYYYQALAGLAGQRPAVYGADVIEAVERILQSALRVEPNAPHASAIWALIKEDYYSLRGLWSGPPSLGELHRSMANITGQHANEIVHHIRAPECKTWQILHHRSTG